MTESWDDAVARVSADVDEIEESLRTGEWQVERHAWTAPDIDAPAADAERAEAVRKLLERYRRVRDAVDEAMLDTADRLTSGRSTTNALRRYLGAETLGRGRQVS